MRTIHIFGLGADEAVRGKPSPFLHPAPSRRGALQPTLRILLIEDHEDLAGNICDYLEEHGHLVDIAQDGVTGLHLAVVNPYDVIVLDLMLPGMDGLTLCDKLRRECQMTVPILMLTARVTLSDKEAGYASGADDYQTKPFVLRELELRLKALHRRAQGYVTQSELRVGDLVFNPRTRQVRRGDRVIPLSPIPMRILELLMKRSPDVVWRQEIEHVVWGDLPPDSDTLRVHMHTLRSALDLPGHPGLLRTIRGIGYQLVDDHALLS